MSNQLDLEETTDTVTSNAAAVDTPTTTRDKVNAEGREGALGQKTEHPLTEIVRFALLAIIIVVPIRMFIAQPFIVSGASMDDTFSNGQYLIVDQLSYYFNDPERGDVVIFRYPQDTTKFFIKRVIGLPGETVIIEDAVVTIISEEYPAGLILDETYVDSMQPTAPMNEPLGDREYFVMGDNRDQSSDSRVWGVLQKERIVGRAWMRLFPPTAIDFMPGKVETTGAIIQPN